MIKVLNIISDTNIGGAGRVLLNYAKYRDQEKFDMSVILPSGSMLTQPLRQLSAEVYEIDAMADRSFDRDAVGMLKELIRKIDPDIVHTHGSLSGRIAARACGKKIVYTRHCAFPVKGYMKHGPGRWANQLLNRCYADRIIAVGQATKENLVESGISEKYIDMMMNGSEQIRLPEKEERRELRASYGFDDSDFVVGIMARIEVYKGHGDILEALHFLLEEGRKVKLIIAGTGSYEEELRREAERFPEGTVVFAGFISDISKILSVMDVQINASYESETSSLSIIEGMSAGVPSVVSDCGGNPLLIEDGINGLVFPARDCGALAGCIRTLMDDREKYHRMQKASCQIYEEKFTGGKFAANVEKVYEKMMKGDSHGK